MKKEHPYVFANWKMNHDFRSATQYVSEFLEKLAGSQKNKKDYVFFPPALCSFAFTQKDLQWGGQNISEHESGAYTGENSILAFQELGATYGLVGHSERRALYNDSDEVIAKKIELLLKHKMTPVLCVGENLSERQSGKTWEKISQQLETALSGVEKSSPFIVAYEPVWAIGTGEVATPEQAQEIHEQIRTWLVEKGASSQTIVLYGGSVKPSNSKNLFAQKDIDGFLVGGASLKVETLLEIE